MNRYLWFVVLVVFITSMAVRANAELEELEGIISQELEKKSFNKKSYLEIQQGLDMCKGQIITTITTPIAPEAKALSFSCRTQNSEILVTESLIRADLNGHKTIESYQEISVVDKIISPQDYLKLLSEYEGEPISTKDEVTPGLRAFGSFARVGIPIALAVRASKVIAPNRPDWQSHFIAGSLISGVTILSTRGIVRFVARKRGVRVSERKVAVVSSMAGLIVSLVAGGGKEIYDRTGRGTPELRDALFTAAGGAFVSLFNLPWKSFHRPFPDCDSLRSELPGGRR